MNIFLSLLSLVLISWKSIWLSDLEKAKQIAREKHEFILLNFSGSDWCGPCIRLHDEIFGSDVFKEYADHYLVLVNADFPRLKKNQLPKDQQKQNNALADKYNKDGVFPYTLLLDASGKIIKSWEGFYDPGPKAFIDEIKYATDYKPD